jgi:uncharacterized membrane protein YhaH (DUF805 family)
MFNLFFGLDGRIGRAKWWLGHLALTINLVVTGLVLVAGFAEKSSALISLGGLLALVQAWSVFCLAVKRYHDIGKSGWWYLIGFVPLIGAIWMLVELGFVGGDLGDNDYGPGPGLDIDDEIAELAGRHPREEAFSARNFTPLPVAPAHRPSPAGNLSPSFGKRV